MLPDLQITCMYIFVLQPVLEIKNVVVLIPNAGQLNTWL